MTGLQIQRHVGQTKLEPLWKVAHHLERTQEKYTTIGPRGTGTPE